MSHFFVTVILPKGTKKTNVESTVANLIDRYDENKEVEEYDAKCYCVGRQAQEEIHKKVWEGMEEIRKEFNEKYKDKDSVLKEEIWKTEVFSPRKKKYEKLLANHRLKDSPNPLCTECNGTGLYKTTYNPDSKWDWWVIGGRWDGGINKKPRIDEVDGGFNFGEDHHQAVYNMAKVSDLMKNEIDMFALVTPEGEWIEKGNMGWWAIVTDEKECDLFEKQKLDIFTKYANNWAVGVDCHI